MWTSSTDTPPGTPTCASAPTASADSRASAGRTALPPSPAAGLPSRSIQPKWYAATVSIGAASRATASRIGGVQSVRPRASRSRTVGVSLTVEPVRASTCVPSRYVWPAANGGRPGAMSVVG